MQATLKIYFAIIFTLKNVEKHEKSTSTKLKILANLKNFTFVGECVFIRKDGIKLKFTINTGKFNILNDSSLENISTTHKINDL